MSKALSPLATARREVPVIFVGVDENGLGPQLGPLVATAAAFRGGHGSALEGVGDSKRFSGFGKMAGAESLSLALCEQLFGDVPQNSLELLALVDLEMPEQRQKRCPSTSRKQCWRSLALPRYGGSVRRGREMLTAFAEIGLEPVGMRSTISCVKDLNDELNEGRSKLKVDLDMFERLILSLADEQLDVVCGMVGGIRDYRGYFRHFKQAEATVVERGNLHYQVPDVGKVSFEVKADDKYLSVGVASMVGKYVREVTMEAIVSFYQEHDERLEKVSGYYDSRTKGFVDNAQPLQKRLKIAADCFRRRA